MSLGVVLPLTLARAADSVETVQQAAADWAKLRTETVRLQTEWQWQRDALQASLTALRDRIKTLTAERDTLQAGIATETAAHASVAANNEAARAGLATVETRVHELTRQVLAVRPFLPPRLAEGLQLAFKSIEDPALGPAERMQHVVTIFNRCGAFNKSITFAEQELALDGSGDVRLLEVLYVGLSHAYAYDRTHRVAYLGRPDQKGWNWTPQPDAGDEVARMLAIYHEQSDPEFVAVPAQVAEPFAEAAK